MPSPHPSLIPILFPVAGLLLVALGLFKAGLAPGSIWNGRRLLPVIGADDVTSPEVSALLLHLLEEPAASTSPLPPLPPLVQEVFLSRCPGAGVS